MLVFCNLRGNLRDRLATQVKSLRKFNLRPLAGPFDQDLKAILASHHYGPGPIPAGPGSYLVEFVVGSLLVPRVFSQDSSVFLPAGKPTSPSSHSIRIEARMKGEGASSQNIVTYFLWLGYLFTFASRFLPVSLLLSYKSTLSSTDLDF